MRIMTMYEALLAYGQNNLFCCGEWLTKQISTPEFGIFCLILPHDPHVFRIVVIAGIGYMRFMRMYEGGIFNGFYLPCIEMGMRSRPKHEASMRQTATLPHVFQEVAYGC